MNDKTDNLNKMRGVNYSSNYLNGSSANLWSAEIGQVPYDLADIKSAGFTHVKIYMNDTNAANQQTGLDLIANAGLKAIALLFVTHNTDFSFSSGQANRNTWVKKLVDTVKLINFHPAVEAIGFGNEQNFNLGATSKPDWYLLVNEAIGAAKQVNNLPAYYTVFGDVADIEVYGSLMPNVDVWAANVYRGTTFTDLYQDIKRCTTSKPFILTEFGRSRTSDEEVAQATQAGEVVALLQEAERYYPRIMGHIHFKFADSVVPGTVYGMSTPLAQSSTEVRPKVTMYTSIKNYFAAHGYGK
jgi:hypothetical protein